MPKPTDYDKTHLRNLAAIGTRIDRIFKKATEEAAKIGASIKATLPDDRIFSFDDFPETKKQLDRLLQALKDSMEVTIVNGVESAWTLSNNKNNALVARIFGDNAKKLPEEQYRRYFSTNGSALDAFLQRQVQGLNLSDRVWKYTNLFKSEIELALDLGIRSGESAAIMTRSLRKYLQHPDKLFRRVRDQHGHLRLSKAAQAFHPGRGVYRSSYKNARRLAATETNIAYRTSDYLRWQQMDFVVGIEIKLSNNHTLNGVPFTDICDTLKGRYPKDFKFVGWHPHCRCHAVSVLKTEDEMAEDTQRIMAGQQPLPPDQSRNAVNDVPKGFDEWIVNNASRTATSKTLPYFMLDNPKYVAESFRKATNGNRTSFAKDMLRQMPYLEAMSQRDPRVAAIWNQLDIGSSSMSDIEKAMLLGKARGICGQLTYADLKQRGLIGEDWVMWGVDRNYLVQQRKSLAVSHSGEVIRMKEVKMDMVVVRDTNGRQFGYPVGAHEGDNYFSAKTASEIIAELPPVLQEGIKRVSFYPQECPTDPFWRKEYRNPNHVSAMTDGGMTSVWKCIQKCSRKTFKELISHEAGHILDDNTISISEEWRKAVQADLEYYRTRKYPVLHGGAVSKYGANNACEDFAESMRMFICNREEFKTLFPHREAFLARTLQGR